MIDRTRLGESEDVVDEDQEITALLVAEVLRDRETGERDPEARARRLVHLTEDHRHLVDDARLLHLAEQLRPFARTLAYSAEDGVAAVLGCDVADQLLDNDGLARAGTAEDGRLPPFEERANQVDDLHARLEDLRLRRLLGERRRRTVDWIAPIALHVAFAVDRLADDVEEPAERGLADRDGDGPAGPCRVHTAAEPIGSGHGDGAHPIVAEVLLDFGDHLTAVLSLDHKRVVDLGQVAFFELDVEDRADDLHDLAYVVCLLLCGFLRGDSHLSYPLPRASAPDAISSISLVMRD